jgi:hypothetical protein
MTMTDMYNNRNDWYTTARGVGQGSFAVNR